MIKGEDLAVSLTDDCAASVEGAELSDGSESATTELEISELAEDSE